VKAITQFLLTVSGNDFRHDSLVSWNGSFLATTFVSSHERVATITATDVAQSGTVLVSVFLAINR
jgi:IPT/TIG domain